MASPAPLEDAHPTWHADDSGAPGRGADDSNGALDHAVDGPDDYRHGSADDASKDGVYREKQVKVLRSFPVYCFSLCPRLSVGARAGTAPSCSV